MSPERYLLDTSPSAIQQNAILLHKDPEFEALAGQVSLEALPYKEC